MQQLQSELALVQSKAGAETEALSQREGKLQKQLQKLLGELEKEKEHQLETLQEVGQAVLGCCGVPCTCRCIGAADHTVPCLANACCGNTYRMHHGHMCAETGLPVVPQVQETAQRKEAEMNAKMHQMESQLHWLSQENQQLQQARAQGLPPPAQVRAQHQST